MKVLIVTQGQQIDNYTSISRSLQVAYQHRGIVCDLYDLSLYLNKLASFLARKTTVVWAWLLNRVNENLKDTITAKGYTHVLVIKGSYLLADTVQEIAQSGTCTILCFNPDDPFSPAITNVFPNIRQAVPFYHHYFIWSKPLKDQLQQAGSTNVHYLPFFIDPSVIYPVTPTRFDAVSLISAVDQERQRYVDSIDNVLQSHKAFDLVIYGEGWKAKSHTIIRKPARGTNLLKAIAESKINLNILRLQNKGAVNMRTFEVPAAGGFLLHEYSDEALDFFEADKEMVFFNSAEELIEKSLYYLKNEQHRVKIAQAGYNRVINSRYTYDSMVAKIIDNSGVR